MPRTRISLVWLLLPWALTLPLQALPPELVVRAEAALHAEIPVPSGPAQAGAKTMRLEVGALKNAELGNTVIALRGHLTKQLKPGVYLFSDGTGVVPVHIATYLFPPTPVTPETPLEIRGTLKREFLANPEMDVATLQVLGDAVDALADAQDFSLGELLKKPIDGLPVSVRGELVFFLDEGSFIFRDGSGLMRVDAEGMETDLLDYRPGARIRILGRTMVRAYRTRGEVRTELKAYRLEPLAFAPAAVQ
ncbi:MAG: NirD/YgiW/YdeI family stress tolerance protein [Opitutales bacterium]